MRHLAGSCLCGSVRYEGEAEPAFVGFCHCRYCQKGSGAGYSANVAVRADQIRIEGPLRKHTYPGGSAESVVRTFCGQCGSPVTIQCGGALKGLALLQAGTLEDASWVEPNVHIFCASAQPWDVVPDNAPRLAGAPPPA